MQELQQYAFSSTSYTGYYPLNRRLDDAADAESEVSWKEDEWAKLIGVWKAPHYNGVYRIKRITRGREVLEYHNADGDLLNSSETDMKIDRKRAPEPCRERC